MDGVSQVAAVVAVILAAVFAALWWRARGRHATCELVSASPRRLALLAESAHDILLMIDDDGRIVEANASAVDTYGYPREELIGLHVWQLRAPATRDALQGQFYRAQQGERFTFETVHRRRDGSEFPVEVSTGSQEVDGRRWVLSIVRDITARRTSEEALRESEARFREAFHGASLGIVLVDASGGLVEWNDALERMLGYPGEELAHLRFQDLLFPEDRAGSLEAFAALVRGERDHNEMERRYVRKDGRVVQLHYRVAALRTSSGSLHRAIGIVEDVTGRIEREEERRRMQAQLALTDRMASLGTLAASVAHEINNPLSYVISNVDMARGALQRLAPAGDVPAEIAELLAEASEGAVRVHQIAGDLKVLSSSREEEDALVDVRAVLRSSANLARRLIAERARLVTELPEVPWVNGNAARLGQVFLNLLVNAAQAIPPGNVCANRVRAATSLDAAGRVVVEVEDTGVGIPSEHLGRIFDPFFTTKPAGVGTGLGLAICQSIVAEHGGAIRVETEAGRGTTFRILLPGAALEGVRAPPASPPAPAGAARRGRILVVDDEPFVRRTLERILAPRHEVVLASGGCEALARIGDGPPLDGVLCDVMMPGMNGMELYREIARRDPALAAQVVFVTGGALVAEVRDFLDAARAPVVEKPFAPAEILEAVGRLVGAAAKAREVR